MFPHSTAVGLTVRISCGAHIDDDRDVVAHLQTERPDCCILWLDSSLIHLRYPRVRSQRYGSRASARGGIR